VFLCSPLISSSRTNKWNLTQLCSELIIESFSGNNYPYSFPLILLILDIDTGIAKYGFGQEMEDVFSEAITEAHEERAGFICPKSPFPNLSAG